MFAAGYGTLIGHLYLRICAPERSRDLTAYFLLALHLKRLRQLFTLIRLNQAATAAIIKEIGYKPVLIKNN
jgi:hypothetical protein